MLNIRFTRNNPVALNAPGGSARAGLTGLGGEGMQCSGDPDSMPGGDD